MTFEEIREALETADALPAEALPAAVEQAAVLAPEVIGLLNRAAAGEFLLPRQRNLLFYGLYALAAARAAAALPPLLALLRQPEPQLDRLFGVDGITEDLARLLVSLYDGNADQLFAAIEDPAVEGYTKWSIFTALARLVRDGRVDREWMVSALDRFDREELAPAGDAAWEGWEDAVACLGLTEFEERAQRGWEAGRVALQHDGDRVDFRERLHRAAANPGDPSIFDRHSAPIDDPVEALTPVRPWAQEEAGDEAGEEAAEPPHEPPDPAADIALTDQEIDWLDDFLTSEKAPASAATLEQLDGILAALVVAPERIARAKYLPAVWGTEDGEEAAFDNPEQREFFYELLERHRNTIARRVEAGGLHPPLLENPQAADAGCAWAFGFMVGVGLRPSAWQPFLRSRKMAPMLAVLSILAEAYDQPFESAPLDPEDEVDIAAALSQVPLAVHRFWQDHAAGFREDEPLRSTKIGRNEPCPCGSGRKYKRCCGAGGRLAL